MILASRIREDYSYEKHQWVVTLELGRGDTGKVLFSKQYLYPEKIPPHTRRTMLQECLRDFADTFENALKDKGLLDADGRTDRLED